MLPPAGCHFGDGDLRGAIFLLPEPSILMRKIRRRMTNRGTDLDDKGNGGTWLPKSLPPPLAMSSFGRSPVDATLLRFLPLSPFPLFPVAVVNHLVSHNIRDG